MKFLNALASLSALQLVSLFLGKGDVSQRCHGSIAVKDAVIVAGCAQRES
jgi:hypothetical protein